MLTLTDMTAAYTPGATVLRGISLSLEPNSISAVVGSNGAGKTTMLRAILGQMPFMSGAVSLSGRRLDGLRPHEVINAGIRAVPEGRGTFPSLTVEENLDLGGYSLSPSARLRNKDREFARFPILKDRRTQHAGMLSGGEQQMLAIARAMMADPRLLLLDEPSQGLAPIIVDQIFALFEDLRAEGVTILLVEQDVGRALEVSDTAFLIEKGAIVRSDAAAVMLADPTIREAFLGVG